MRHYTSIFVILKIIRTFLKKVKFAFFSKKLKNLSLNFGLMITKTSLIVFIIFLGQLGYIVMSDGKKNRNIYFLKEKSDSRLFLSRQLKLRG